MLYIKVQCRSKEEPNIKAEAPRRKRKLSEHQSQRRQNYQLSLQLNVNLKYRIELFVVVDRIIWPNYLSFSYTNNDMHLVLYSTALDQSEALYRKRCTNDSSTVKPLYPGFEFNFFKLQFQYQFVQRFSV